MKKILFIYSFLLFFIANGQKKVSYSEVIKVNDSSKSAKYLYSNAKMWFSKNFTDPKETIILDDPENNIIMGRGYIKYKSRILLGSATREGWITYDILISSKQGRYKYEFMNFIHQSSDTSLGLITEDEILPTQRGNQGGPKGFKIRVVNELKENINSTVNPLLISLKSTMNENISTKEDW